MKFKVVLAAAALTVSHFAQAALPPRPDHCPSVSDLKSHFFFLAQKDPQGHGWAVVNVNKYNTQDMWGFVVGFFNVDNYLQAVLKGNMALKSLRGNPDPIPVEQAGTWACQYGVEGNGVQAVAMSPLPTEPNMLNALS